MKILNLHSHSEFSNASCGFKDSINKLEDLLNYAYDNGHAGIGLTDHESVTSHIQAFDWWENKIKSAETDEEREKAENFKVVLGNEIYIGREGLTSETHGQDENFFHFLLLATDKEGQKQLRELSSMAWEKAYMKNVMRRFNYISELREVIKPNQGHVKATTACLANLAGYAYQNFSPADATNQIDGYLEIMNDIFGQGNFYIELSPALYQEQKDYNTFMYNQYKDKYPFVITNDVHYLTSDDAKTMEIVLGSKERMEQYYKYAHFMTWEQIVSNLDYIPVEFLEQAAQNALDIGAQAERYSLKHKTVIPKVPYDKVEIPQDMIADALQHEYIRKFIESEYEADRTLVAKVLSRYLQKEVDTPERRKSVLNRLNDEWEELWGISEVQGTRVSDYLLTMSWIVKRMWESGTLVGPGRGSAVAFVTNYYLDITDVNPVDYPVYIPHWRFLSSERPEYPDIDIDSPGADREKVINYITKEFEKLGGHVIQVQTYGKETSKKAINTIGKGLGIGDETLAFINSLIPSERGNQLTLGQCYYGDDEHEPVKRFVEQMDENPELWEHVQKIEGLITQMGVHPGGLILSNHRIQETNSIMKTKRGVLVTAYDLHESEDTGLIKYDILSVDGLGKLKTVTYLLLQDNKIEWQGDLEHTFKKYFSPRNLKPDDKVWYNIANGRVNSLFQLNTQVGQAAVRLLHVESVEEIGMINSLMRLQPQSQGERQPLEIFADHRKNINLWYNEMKRHGLTEHDIKIMEKHLLRLYGVADTQEAIMLMSMDKEISGFSVKEANILRKSIARKNPKAQEEIRQLFYKKGTELGTSRPLLDYVWGVQIRYSLGYSFSLPHVAAYSYIALQEACIFSQFPEIYWNTACLIDDAGAFTEEDFPELVELGYLQASDKYYEIQEAEYLSDVKIETTAIDRDKIATSIAMFQDTMTILPPDINTSGFGFTLNEEEESVQSGLKLVSRLGNKFIYEIIRNRPYYSFEDFVDRVNVSKDRVVMLIKAGAFRKISNGRDQMELLKEYARSTSNPKKRLNGQNIQMLIRMELLPQELDYEIRVFNWWKYLRGFRKVRTGYVQLDEPALNFYTKNFDESKLEYFPNGTFIQESYGKSLVDKTNNNIKAYIKQHHDSLLEQVNEQLFQDEWEKYKMRSIEEGEMQSLRMYTDKHPLSKYNLEYDSIYDMREDHFVGEFNIQGRRFPKYYIYRTVGTVIAKDKLKNTITLLTPEGAIVVKMWKDVFATFDKKSSIVIDGIEQVVQNSFFEIGTHLAIFGMYKNEMLFPKIYKDTGPEFAIYKLTPKDGEMTLETKLD